MICSISTQSKKTTKRADTNKNQIRKKNPNTHSDCPAEIGRRDEQSPRRALYVRSPDSVLASLTLSENSLRTSSLHTTFEALRTSQGVLSSSVLMPRSSGSRRPPSLISGLPGNTGHAVAHASAFASASAVLGFGRKMPSAYSSLAAPASLCESCSMARVLTFGQSSRSQPSLYSRE